NSKIIQWNCRGLKANFNEISLLLNDKQPAVICLQETLFNDKDTITFKNHSMYNFIFPSNKRVRGGVSVIVINRTLHSPISLKTNLPAVAVRVTLHKTIIFCSRYIPPPSNINI
ncbi:hypothetical protein ScPMuIL_012089, partial [Solemya velum]